MKYKINSILKRTILFFNSNPAYLGFCGAIIGVFWGGLISLYSLKFSKEMEFAASRKKHIEQIYLNLEFSFSLFKDGILRYYCSDLAAFHSERIFNIKYITNEKKEFYENKFRSNMERIDADENLFSEHKAAFYRDYKALNLYIDLKRFDDYFYSSFDTCLLSYIDSLKKIPAETLNLYDETQFESMNKLLVKKIIEVNKNSDSVLSIIHDEVLLEIKR